MCRTKKCFDVVQKLKIVSTNVTKSYRRGAPYIWQRLLANQLGRFEQNFRCLKWFFRKVPRKLQSAFFLKLRFLKIRLLVTWLKCLPLKRTGSVTSEVHLKVQSWKLYDNRHLFALVDRFNASNKHWNF